MERKRITDGFIAFVAVALLSGAPVWAQGMKESMKPMEGMQPMKGMKAMPELGGMKMGDMKMGDMPLSAWSRKAGTTRPSSSFMRGP